MLLGTKEGPAGQHNFKRAGGGSENQQLQAAIQYSRVQKSIEN